jgi:mono/diheme cytochrome c family protein
MATPTPEPAPAATPVPSNGPVTFEQVGELFKTRCGACHGTTGMKGLNVLTYATLMAGGENGPVIIPGNPDNSLLVQVQSAAKSHFGQFTPDELAIVKQWILDGALEK